MTPSAGKREIDEFIRNVTKMLPRQKSEIRRRLNDLLKQARAEQHSKSFNEGYKAGTDKCPAAYQKGRSDVILERI